VWNEAGEIRALLDDTVDIRFDEDDERGWTRLREILTAVVRGELVLERRLPISPWKARVPRSHQRLSSPQNEPGAHLRKYNSYGD
jgi:hypothetical protein